jgi:hypothetical protein
MVGSSGSIPLATEVLGEVKASAAASAYEATLVISETISTVSSWTTPRAGTCTASASASKTAPAALCTLVLLDDGPCGRQCTLG